MTKPKIRAGIALAALVLHFSGGAFGQDSPEDVHPDLPPSQDTIDQLNDLNLGVVAVPAIGGNPATLGDIPLYIVEESPEDNEGSLIAEFPSGDNPVMRLYGN